MATLKKTDDQHEAIPMAPMIDMVFLLLVFFMTVSTVANSVQSIELELPESETAAVGEEKEGRGIISIDPEGHYYLSGTVPMSLDDIQTQIKIELGKKPDLKLQIRASKDTPYKEIKAVLTACASVGAYDIIYSTYLLQ